MCGFESRFGHSNWAARLTGRHLACNQKTGVRFLGGPLQIRLDSEMDIMPRFERGVPGSNPGRGAQTWCSKCKGTARGAVNAEEVGSIPPGHPVKNASMLLGEHAASKTASRGSNPRARAEKQVLGVCRIARDPAKVEAQVRLLARAVF